MKGSTVDVWIRATISEELVSEVIIQAAPTDWIIAPKFDTSEAIHTARKVRTPNGEDGGAVTSLGASDFILLPMQ
jgi:hypothetical protein